MGRPKNYDRTEILDRAMRTFWRQGYEATSTSDLEAAMGVNRSSIYAEFRSKHELYRQAMDHYLVHIVPGFIGELQGPQADLAAIHVVLDRFAWWAGAPGKEAGCMMCNAATETAADDAASHSAVQRYVAALEGGFRNALDNAVAQGQLRADLDTPGWSHKLATTLLGIMVLVRAQVDPSLARGAATRARQELERETLR